MFSLAQEENWTNWLVDQIIDGSSVLRLSLQKSLTIVHMDAMVLHSTYVGGQKVVGFINYDSLGEEIFHRRNGMKIPETLQYVTVRGTANHWTHLVKQHCQYRSEWMTEAKTLCLFRDNRTREIWTPMPMHGILPVMFLGRLLGMVQQAYAGATNEDHRDFLCASSIGLEVLLDQKYNQLAGIAAGLN